MVARIKKCLNEYNLLPKNRCYFKNKNKKMLRNI